MHLNRIIIVFIVLCQLVLLKFILMVKLKLHLILVFNFRQVTIQSGAPNRSIESFYRIWNTLMFNLFFFITIYLIYSIYIFTYNKFMIIHFLFFSRKKQHWPSRLLHRGLLRDNNPFVFVTQLTFIFLFICFLTVYYVCVQ